MWGLGTSRMALVDDFKILKREEKFEKGFKRVSSIPKGSFFGVINAIS